MKKRSTKDASPIHDAPTDPHEEAAARMRLWVGRARACGALVGFAIGMLVCRRAGIPLVDSTLRSLIAALVLSGVAWWSTLLVLQALIRTAAAQRRAEMEAALAEAAAAATREIENADDAADPRSRRQRGESDGGAADGAAAAQGPA